MRKRTFVVRIKTGKSPGLFDVYYDTEDPPQIKVGYICKIHGTDIDAINLTYEQLTELDGIKVDVPDTAEYILLYDQQNQLCEEIPISVECDLEVELLNSEELVPTPEITDEPVFNCPDLWIPEGFSPNDDNINDLFIIPYLGECYINNEMSIFNRAGQLVFKTNFYHLNWWDGIQTTKTFWGKGVNSGTQYVKGSKVPPGNYIYIFKIYSLRLPGYEKTYNGTIMVSY